MSKDIHSSPVMFAANAINGVGIHTFLLAAIGTRLGRVNLSPGVKKCLDKFVAVSSQTSYFCWGLSPMLKSFHRIKERNDDHTLNNTEIASTASTLLFGGACLYNLLVRRLPFNAFNSIQREQSLLALISGGVENVIYHKDHPSDDKLHKASAMLNTTGVMFSLASKRVPEPFRNYFFKLGCAGWGGCGVAYSVREYQRHGFSKPLDVYGISGIVTLASLPFNNSFVTLASSLVALGNPTVSRVDRYLQEKKSAQISR